MNTNAFRLLLFTVAMYIGAWTFNVRLLFYLAYVMTAVLIGSWIWARVNLMALDVRREARQHQVQMGDTFEEVFTVRNRSFWPKLWLEVRDHSTLPGHQAAAVVGLRGGQGQTLAGPHHLPPPGALCPGAADRRVGRPVRAVS